MSRSRLYTVRNGMLLFPVGALFRHERVYGNGLSRWERNLPRRC